MSSVVLDQEKTMGRPKKSQSKDQPKRTDVPVRIDEEVLNDIRIVATLRNISIAEYLSEVMRPIARRDADAEIECQSQQRKKPRSGR